MLALCKGTPSAPSGHHVAAARALAAASGTGHNDGEGCDDLAVAAAAAAAGVIKDAIGEGHGHGKREKRGGRRKARGVRGSRARGKATGDDHHGSSSNSSSNTNAHLATGTVPGTWQHAVIEDMVAEIADVDTIKHLLHDQYANYVVQRALLVTGREHCLRLVEAIRPHLPGLRHSSCGRRVVNRILKRFPDAFLGGSGNGNGIGSISVGAGIGTAQDQQQQQLQQQHGEGGSRTTRHLAPQYHQQAWR